HGTHIALVEPRGHREDGLLVLPPQFVRAAHDPDRRELVERDKAEPRSRGRARRWRGRSGRGHRETYGQTAQVFPVVPYPVGIADADLGHPILLGDRAGYLAVEGGVELALHVELGEADARGLNAVGTDHNIGIAEANVSVYIDDACDLLDDFAHFGRKFAEGRRLRPEDLDLDRLLNARKVVDLIHHEGFELSLELGDRCLQLLSERIEDLVHGAALPRGLQTHEDVAGEALGSEEAQLGAGPANVALDAGRIEQHLLDPAEDLVGLAQRRPNRHV